MKVSEIKAATNDDLIMVLCHKGAYDRFGKGDEKDVVRIIKELEQRGVTTPAFGEKCMKFMKR